VSAAAKGRRHPQGGGGERGPARQTNKARGLLGAQGLFGDSAENATRRRLRQRGRSALRREGGGVSVVHAHIL
jgi:hypothetical protein